MVDSRCIGGLLVLLAAAAMTGCTVEGQQEATPSPTYEPRQAVLNEWATFAGPEGIDAGSLYCGGEGEPDGAIGDKASEAGDSKWEWDGEFLPYIHQEVDPGIDPGSSEPGAPDGTPVEVARMTSDRGIVLYVEVLADDDSACIAGIISEAFFLSRSSVGT